MLHATGGGGVGGGEGGRGETIFMPVCLSVCLPVCLGSVCLSVRGSLSLSLSLSFIRSLPIIFVGSIALSSVSMTHTVTEFCNRRLAEASARMEITFASDANWLSV